MFRRVCAVVLVFLCVFGWPLDEVSRVYAGLDEAVQWLFMSASTSPRAYESQRRMGFVGGTMMARTPIKSVNVISFAPPKLDAGCGGIDMFLGSFSFINMDQFIQMLRAIAANAVGLAFKAALHAISPSLEALISKLETMVNNLNRTFRNSCTIASNLGSLFSGIGSVGDMIKQSASEIATRFRNSKGIANDFFDALKEEFSNPDVAYEGDSQPNLNPSVGNLVWKAFYLNNLPAYIGNPQTAVGNVLGSDGKQMAMYVMSITGTVVNIPPDEDVGGDECDGERCTNVIVREYPPILQFVDLLEGNTANNRAQYYQCNTTASEMGCTGLQVATFPFKGTRAYVSEMLFGYEDGYLTGVYTSDSIVGRVISGGDLSSQQRVFLDVVPAPVLWALMQVQRDPNAVVSVASVLAPFVAEQLAVLLGRAIIKAAKGAFAGQYRVDKPEFYDRNLEVFANDMRQYVKSGEELMEYMNNLYMFVVHMKRTLGAGNG